MKILFAGNDPVFAAVLRKGISHFVLFQLKFSCIWHPKVQTEHQLYRDFVHLSKEQYLFYSVFPKARNIDLCPNFRLRVRNEHTKKMVLNENNEPNATIRTKRKKLPNPIDWHFECKSQRKAMIVCIRLMLAIIPIQHDIEMCYLSVGAEPKLKLKRERETNEKTWTEWQKINKFKLTLFSQSIETGIYLVKYINCLREIIDMVLIFDDPPFPSRFERMRKMWVNRSKHLKCLHVSILILSQTHLQFVSASQMRARRI